MRNRHQVGVSILLFFFVWLLPVGVHAQQKCALPPLLSSLSGANFFTPEQEIDLGDLMAEQTEIRYQVIRDAELTSYMNRVAGRLVAQLPTAGLRIQIILIDAPIVNAFGTPGGRIYVSRKLVAFLRNEDELAALLGHEMGHIVTHQSAIEMTMLFQKVLGATQLTSREDLAAKYNQLLDNASRGTEAYRKIAHEEEPNQYVADQVALYAAANAGYAPRAVIDFFDRLAQTHGKTGTFFSNWFGLTNPEEKRLGEMQKAFAGMPASCAAPTTPPASAEFQTWQSEVIGHSRIVPAEILPGLLAKQQLNPPLRGDITHVHFSPDGEYALAQDEANIFVLTRLPFAYLFRIDAPDARPASFTADSKEIVFSTPSLRVEEWNIAGQKRISVHEMSIRDDCVQSLLSPDGKTIACLAERGASTLAPPFSFPYFDLEIFDAASGEAIFTKKRFLEGSIENSYYLAILLFRGLTKTDLVDWAFSPDAHYLVTCSQGGNLAVDVTTNSQVSIRGTLKEMLKGSFAFLSSDHVIVENTQNPAKSAILNFPSGEIVTPITLGTQSLEASTQGTYLFLRPVANAQVGVMDVRTGKGVLGLKQTSAVDVYNELYITQNSAGEIGLYDLKSKNYSVKANLPMGPLGSLQTGTVSADFHWLAVSGDTRGAVWSLPEMKRLYYLRGFRGGYFDNDGSLYIDFPKKDTTARSIVQANLSMFDLKPVRSLDEDFPAAQYGRFLVSRRPNRKDKISFWDVKLQVADVRDGKDLWQTNFPKLVPRISILPSEDRILIEWNLETSTARESVREEAKKYDALEKRIGAIKGDAGVHVVESLELSSGTFRGAVVVDTGRDSFRIEGETVSGDWLLVTDDDNRTRVYSIATGELKGSVFGSYPVVSSSVGLMGVHNERGQLQFYKLPSLEKAGQLSFSGLVSMDKFSADGNRFFVLTNDQNVYTFDSVALGKTAPSTTTRVN
jgi:WD40 repeat protein